MRDWKVRGFVGITRKACFLCHQIVKIPVRGGFMAMNFRVQVQLDEAFGSLNRWYCSQAHRRKIDDKELLLRYFINSGGADDFADRYEQAMGAMNRWFCSEFYGRDIRDEEILWNYYMERHPARRGGRDSQNESQGECGSIAAMALT
jgi:hypothetical protein